MPLKNDDVSSQNRIDRNGNTLKRLKNPAGVQHAHKSISKRVLEYLQYFQSGSRAIKYCDKTPMIPYLGIEHGVVQFFNGFGRFKRERPICKEVQLKIKKTMFRCDSTDSPGSAARMMDGIEGADVVRVYDFIAGRLRRWRPKKVSPVDEQQHHKNEDSDCGDRRDEGGRFHCKRRTHTMYRKQNRACERTKMIYR
jgi:hypothetical protein